MEMKKNGNQAVVALSLFCATGGKNPSFDH
jgi:hypothetical protein